MFYTEGTVRNSLRHQLKRGMPVHPNSPNPRDRRTCARHREDLWSRRRGSAATVMLRYTRDRYPLGELAVRTTYRLPDGARDLAQSRRVYLGNTFVTVLREIWDVVFDQATRAQQYDPRSVVLRLRLKGIPRLWGWVVRIVVELIAYELKLVVKGADPIPLED